MGVKCINDVFNINISINLYQYKYVVSDDDVSYLENSHIQIVCFMWLKQNVTKNVVLVVCLFFLIKVALYGSCEKL